MLQLRWAFTGSLPASLSWNFSFLRCPHVEQKQWLKPQHISVTLFQPAPANANQIHSMSVEAVQRRGAKKEYYSILLMIFHRLLSFKLYSDKYNKIVTDLLIIVSFLPFASFHCFRKMQGYFAALKSEWRRVTEKATFSVLVLVSTDLWECSSYLISTVF